MLVHKGKRFEIARIRQQALSQHIQRTFNSLNWLGVCLELTPLKYMTSHETQELLRQPEATTRGKAVYVRFSFFDI